MPDDYLEVLYEGTNNRDDVTAVDATPDGGLHVTMDDQSTWTVSVRPGHVVTPAHMQHLRAEMRAEGTEFSTCAACNAEIIRHPGGRWYHWVSGVAGSVNDPTGRDAMHKVVVADNPDSVKLTLDEVIATGLLDATLYDADTAEAIGPATPEQVTASNAAANKDGGAGIIRIDRTTGAPSETGRRVYTDGWIEPSPIPALVKLFNQPSRLDPDPKVDALRKLLADWFDGELFKISERGMSRDWPALIEDAKARHEAFGIPWSNSFVPGYVREILAMDEEG